MIDHNGAVSLYVQLANILSSAIKKGDYLPGDKLPSENTLCREYGVSRITVRQALQLLTQQDLIFSVHGKGSFVKMPAISGELNRITSFRQVLQQKGLQGSTRVHSCSLRSDRAHEVLGSRTAELELIGAISGAPVVYYRSLFRPELGDQMRQAAMKAESEGLAFSTYDLYSRLGLNLDRVEQTIRAVNASEELARLLEVPVGTALMVLESVYYSETGEALEFKTAHYRSDVYSFHLKRQG